ncbi:MAG: TonB-dependent receptor [Opitutae bacterium]|nr:TonB-dependent receptor [Opitutae bacterium]
MNTPSPFLWLRRFRGAAVFVALTMLTLGAFAEPTKKTYSISAGAASATLAAFTEQSGEQIVYPVEIVRGVRTNAVKGELSARAALEQLVAGTDLVVVQDASTGALGLRRASDQPAMKPATDLQKAVKLDDYRVLGSRIRQTDVAGPSPVNAYDAEYIRSTGAFTLADFLNSIPQTYSGISSGRGSAPNELNPEFGQRTETSTPPFNLILGSSAAPPAQTGVSGVSLRGLGSGSTLVLVDGRRVAQSGSGNRSTDTRQGFVNLNTIPLGMIDRVEVITDGSSAIYGADAVAGVINVVLKKDFVGGEATGATRISEHGGGRERAGTLMQGFNLGKLSGTVAVDYFDRQNLKANHRNFSKNQNHTGIPTGTLLTTGATNNGRDFRLLWGYPAVVQASGGVVSGTFDAIPGIRVVLTPEGSTGTPTIAQFIPTTNIVSPASVVNGSGQRRLNTAEFLDLIPEKETIGLNANFTYKFNDRVEGFGSFRTTKNTTTTNAQISASSITGGFGSAAVLPAAFNPFNQNVSIGMMLVEFGPESQVVRTLDDAVSGGLRGKFAQTWQWELVGTWQNQKDRQISRNYNGGGFVALMTAADPAQRFNPFIDARAAGAPSQAALLERLAVYPSVFSESTASGIDLDLDGDLMNFWGGPIKMAVGGSHSVSKVNSVTTTFSTNSPTPVATRTEVSGEQDRSAVYAELAVPVFGKPNARTFLKRFDLQLAGRHEKAGGFTKTTPKIGFSFVPFDSLLFRASWSQGFRAPGVTEYLVVSPNTTATITDPRRTPASTTGVIVSRGSNLDPQAEASENMFYGIVYEPPFLKGLKLQLDIYETKQSDALQIISAQNIVNNEALFPGRVTRATPSPTDVSLNQPGVITNVDQTFVNFGHIVNRSLDLSADYTLPWQQLGRFRATVFASHTLEATRQVAPGQPAVVLEEDTAAPPKWKYNVGLNWNNDRWSVAAFIWHLDGFGSNSAGNNLVANSASVVYYPTPSVTKVDARIAYEFKNGVWRGYGKRLRVGFGVNNIFDKEPPFSDTIWGFNAALHYQLILGRAYELSFLLPF